MLDIMTALFYKYDIFMFGKSLYTINSLRTMFTNVCTSSKVDIGTRFIGKTVMYLLQNDTMFWKALHANKKISQIWEFLGHSTTTSFRSPCLFVRFSSADSLWSQLMMVDTFLPLIASGWTADRG